MNRLLRDYYHCRRQLVPIKPESLSQFVRQFCKLTRTCRWRNLASCTAARCILPVRQGPDRTSEGLRQLATVLPSLDPHRPAGGCWRGACGAFDGGRFALIVGCRPARSTRGMCQAKEYPENLVVNTLPSKTKEKLCYYYLRLC